MFPISYSQLTKQFMLKFYNNHFLATLAFPPIPHPQLTSPWVAWLAGMEGTVRSLKPGAASNG